MPEEIENDSRQCQLSDTDEETVQDVIEFCDHISKATHMESSPETISFWISSFLRKSDEKLVQMHAVRDSALARTWSQVFIKVADCLKIVALRDAVEKKFADLVTQCKPQSPSGDPSKMATSSQASPDDNPFTGPDEIRKRFGIANSWPRQEQEQIEKDLQLLSASIKKTL